MLTGDYLFEPRQGPNFSKNEDHLAQIQELLGKFPNEYSTRGAKAKRYFTNNGQMKRIPQLHFWSLFNVLQHIQYLTIIFQGEFKIQKYTQQFEIKLIKQLEFNKCFQIMCNREIQIQIRGGIIICFIYDAHVTLIIVEMEYRTTAQEVLKRELCSSNQEELQRKAQLKKYIDQIFNFQNFRNHIPNSGWLNSRTDPQIGHKMNDEEFKKYNKQKKVNEDVEQFDQNINEIQPTLLQNYRRASTRSYDGSNSQTPQQDKVIRKDGKYVDHRVIDRSFTDLGYIGYGDGIDLEQLDSTGNWQFS